MQRPELQSAWRLFTTRLPLGLSTSFPITKLVSLSKYLWTQMNVLNAHNVLFVLTTIVNIILYMFHLE